MIGRLATRLLTVAVAAAVLSPLLVADDTDALDMETYNRSLLGAREWPPACSPLLHDDAMLATFVWEAPPAVLSAFFALIPSTAEPHVFKAIALSLQKVIVWHRVDYRTVEEGLQAIVRCLGRGAEELIVEFIGPPYGPSVNNVALRLIPPISGPLSRRALIDRFCSGASRTDSTSRIDSWRREVLKTLLQVYPESEISQLVDDLDSAGAAGRVYAWESHLSYVIEWCRSNSNPGVRRVAADCFGQYNKSRLLAESAAAYLSRLGMGGFAPSIREAAALESAHPDVRGLAAYTLVFNGDPVLLDGFLTSKCDQVRVRGIEACGETRSRVHCQGILRAAESGHPLERAVAARALGKIGLVEAVPRLIAMLEDRDTVHIAGHQRWHCSAPVSFPVSEAALTALRWIACAADRRVQRPAPTASADPLLWQAWWAGKPLGNDVPVFLNVEQTPGDLFASPF